MGLNYYASAPVLIPQPQHPHHHHQSHQSCFSYNYNPSSQLSSSLYNYQQQFAFSAPSSFKPFASSSPLVRNLRPSKSSVAGHKRSRDDLTAEDDDNDELPAAPTSVPLPIGSQSINGPSMTYNFPSQPGPSSNSTNTQANLFWMQQQQQQASQSSSSFSDRQRATARKSQRM